MKEKIYIVKLNRNGKDKFYGPFTKRETAERYAKYAVPRAIAVSVFAPYARVIEIHQPQYNRPVAPYSRKRIGQGTLLNDDRKR